MNDILAANAEKTEAQGHPTAESLEAARELGAFRLPTPRSAVDVSRQLSELGRDCPSTAWIAGTCLTAKTLAVGTFGELSTDPDALFCGSGNPAGGHAERVDGGVRLTGRWVSASGCEDATWAGLGVMLDGVYSYAIVPVADLTIDRTWHMAGMRGTGSHTLVADLVVPASRVGALRLPGPPEDMLFYGLCVLAPVVGATFGALDVIERMFASDRKPYMTQYANMGESAGARHWLADATRLVFRAERTMLAVATRADAASAVGAGSAAAGAAGVGSAGVGSADGGAANGGAANGGAADGGAADGGPADGGPAGAGLTGGDHARLRADLADAARDCRSAVELMLDLHGTSGFATSNELQRYWRDIAVGSRHPHLNAYLSTEGFGAALVASRT